MGEKGKGLKQNKQTKTPPHRKEYGDYQGEFGWGEAGKGKGE